MAFEMIPNYKKPGERKPFVLSPSNMGSYRQCPCRFYAMTVTGEIQWKSSPQKSRGTVVHEVMERAIKKEPGEVIWPSGVQIPFLLQYVSEMREAAAAGAHVYTEHELVVDAKMRPPIGGWWADSAYLRAKADVVIIPPSPEAYVYDIKTGKQWDSDHFQLRVESLLIHLLYKRRRVHYNYLYVDQGKSIGDTIDFRRGVREVVPDVIDTMVRMKKAFQHNYFPATVNTFCKWCDFHNTEKCIL